MKSVYTKTTINMATKLFLVLALSYLACSETANFLQVEQDPAALSKEIINYIMGDVGKGAAKPDDAYFNILDMVEDGTIYEEDGMPALARLEIILNERGIPFFLQNFADKILEEIIVDVGNCEATFGQADAQGRVMVNAGTITQDKYEMFMINLRLLDLSRC